jgi:hypothetical protein
MAKKSPPKGDPQAQVVALAEQLGWFLGTARAKADTWLQREDVRKQVTRLRDGATELLQHIDAAVRAAQLEATRPKAGAKPKAAKAPRPKSAALRVTPSRGAVDAPGKRHRKPPPQVKLTPAMRRMGEPEGRQMGQKSYKMGTGRKRNTD